MGAFCSCFHVSDDHNNEDCLCPKCFFKRFMNKHAATSANSSNFQLVIENSSNANGSNGGSVANNASLVHLRPQSNEEGLRHEKGTSRSRVQPEPDRLTFDQEKSKLVLKGQKIVDASVNDSSSGVKNGVENSFSDDEDVCPTCLEEYTRENPKIVAKCNHHYHLGCIYEWMERSERCPACGQLMLFDE